MLQIPSLCTYVYVNKLMWYKIFLVKFGISLGKMLQGPYLQWTPFISRCYSKLFSFTLTKQAPPPSWTIKILSFVLGLLYIMPSSNLLKHRLWFYRLGCEPTLHVTRTRHLSFYLCRRNSLAVPESICTKAHRHCDSGGREGGGQQRYLSFDITVHTFSSFFYYSYPEVILEKPPPLPPPPPWLISPPTPTLGIIMATCCPLFQGTAFRGKRSFFYKFLYITIQI